MFTGNRGCLVDDVGEFTRHHRGSLWIICALEYKGWKSPLTAPRRWTPLFFLDEAVALAAGHRPCGLCRRDSYRRFQDGVMTARALTTRPSAQDLNTALHTERLRPGRGVARRHYRILWEANLEDLPSGTVYLANGDTAALINEGVTYRFTFDGWVPGVELGQGRVSVVTPPTSVAALRGGYKPVIHPTGEFG